MLAHNTISYMKYVATDLLGHEPEGKPHPTDPDQWCMRAEGSRLADHLARFGYEVTDYPQGWIGVSGRPTSVERIRDLEVRKAQARAEEIRGEAPERLMQMTARF